MPRPESREGVDLTEFSASRITTASKCGLAFRYNYIDQIPAPYDRAATLFGTAIHVGTELWYGLPDNGWEEQDLAPLVSAQWPKLIPPKIWEHVQVLIDLQQECDAVVAAILFKRPQIKNPTSTKEYITSDAAKDFAQRQGEMLELCDILDEIKWPKAEDPWKAYCKAAAISAQMQRHYRSLPKPLAVEIPFRIQVGDFWMRGRIDQVRVDPDADGVVRPNIHDIKSGKQMPTPMETFIQAWMYCEASAQMEEIPECDVADFYYVRHGKIVPAQIDRKRHGRLARRIIEGKARQIMTGQFEPSYGHWCKMCDFDDLCKQEISLWNDKDVISVGS